MKGIKDFIIQLDKPYSETIKTESGLELYGDKRWSPERMSNRIGIVQETPFNHKTPIQIGYEVLIDPTILYEQMYHLTHGVQQSIFLLDRNKSLYKIEPNMIVLYRENKDSEWKGYLENGLYEIPKKEKIEHKTIHGIIIPKTAQKQQENTIAYLVFGNEELGLEKGVKVLVDDCGGIEFYLEGKSYWWFRNRDLIALIQ